MSTGRLALRQITADGAGAALLVLLIALGSLLGSLAPRWTTVAMDEALLTTAAEHPNTAEVVSRTGIQLSPLTGANFRVTDVAASQSVRDLFGAQRWAAFSGDSTIRTGGEGFPANLKRFTNFRAVGNLAGHTKVTAGRLPQKVDIEDLGPPVDPSLNKPSGVLAVAEAAMTAEVAEALYVEIGDLLVLDWSPRWLRWRDQGVSPAADGLALKITGIIEPTDPSDGIWHDAPTALHPEPPQPGDDTPTTRGTLLAGPEVAEGLAKTARFALPVDWHIPLRTDRLHAGDLEQLLSGFTALESNATAVKSGSDQNYTILNARFGTAFDDVLADFQRRALIAESLAALGTATVGLLLLAVLVLIIALFVDRRAAALQLMSTRGAPVTAIGRLLALQVTLLTVPAAILGTAAAHLLMGHAEPTAFVVPALLTLTALVGIPVLGMRRATVRGRARPEQSSLRPSPRRLAMEAGVVVLALVGLWLLGSPATAGGVDLFLAVVPGLVAAAAGLLTFRLVPYLVLAVSRLLASGRGAVAYLSTVQAARRSGGALLPLVAVLVAVSIGVFAGAVRTTVDHDQALTSWRQVGGDLMVRDQALPLDAADQAAAVQGVRAVAPAHLIDSVRVDTGTADAAGRELAVDLLAVDPDAWSRVSADAPGGLPALHSLTAATPPDGAWAAVLTGSSNDLKSGSSATIAFGEQTVRVQVVDEVDDLPGLPESDPTLLVPAAMLADIPSISRPNILYIAGQPDLDALFAATSKDPDTLLQRSQVLRDLSDEPVLAVTVDQYRVLLIIAVGLAALAVVLGLVATERVRSAALAVLRTLGLTSRQAASMMTWEVVPMTIAAALVGVGAGAAISTVAEQRIGLSTFSSGAKAAGVHLEPVTTVVIATAVGLAIMVSVAVVVLVNRRARLGAVLRVGDQP